MWGRAQEARSFGFLQKIFWVSVLFNKGGLRIYRGGGVTCSGFAHLPGGPYVYILSVFTQIPIHLSKLVCIGAARSNLCLAGGGGVVGASRPRIARKRGAIVD